ncbi:MAG: hypothetical protein JJ971_08445 [Balneolaceae bacterium]|nr:hypothetical protein [Balneolaceae bacterium]MBO6546732.1 hypothetical protein [Balneolaceae bacterium]MBO6649090.1 hypothetical protein [Balneolaceae bacterium]
MMPVRDIAFVRNDSETSKTQLVMVIGLLVIAAIFQNELFAYIALGIGLISLIIPPAGHWLVWGWYKLALILSRVMNPFVLGIVYFFFISPIAILFRLFGNDPMRLKDNKGSIYEIREKTYTKEDLEKPW